MALTRPPPAGEQIFWKVYSWVFGVLVIAGYFTGQFRIWERIDLSVSLGALAGLFLYAYKHRCLNRTVWSIYLVVYVIWDFSYNLAIIPFILYEGDIMETVLGFLFVLPLYIALYRYRALFSGSEKVE